MHWQKSGLDDGTSAATTCQRRLWAWTLSNELFINFNITILNGITTGQDKQ